MIATFSIEADVERLKQRGVSDEFLGKYAALNGVPSASQTRISQALRGTNPFTNEHEPLRTLVLNLDAYCESVAPIPIAFKDPVLIKQLVDEFFKTRQDSLIHGVYVVEFSDDHSLLEAVRDNVVRRTLNSANAAPIKDRATAAAAVSLLDRMGYRCLAHPIRMRVAESQMANNLQDLGFTHG